MAKVERKTNSASLKMISEMAGVNRSTASRILNNNPKYVYAQKTIDNVMNAASACGYRKSQLYKSLFSGETKSAGVITANTSFYDRIISGVHDRLLLDNFAMILGINASDFDDPDNSIEKKVIHRLNEHRVDGFIIRPTLENASDAHFQEIIEMKLPLIAIDRELKSEYADYVGSDNKKGGQLAAEYIVKLGHRNILQIAGSSECSTFRDRALGFESALLENSIIPQTITCVSKDEIIQKCKNILLIKNRPTAIFCHNDNMAGEIYKLAYNLGIKIPDDISIVGFGNQITSQYFCPLLTSIEQYPVKMGYKAAELLLDRLKEDKTKPHERKVIHLEVSLIEKDSCRKL